MFIVESVSADARIFETIEGVEIYAKQLAAAGYTAYISEVQKIRTYKFSPHDNSHQPDMLDFMETQNAILHKETNIQESNKTEGFAG